MKKILSFLLSIFLITNYNAQYCLNGGPSSNADSQIESVNIIGSNGVGINYNGCNGNAGPLGIDDQTALFVDLIGDSIYTLDVQFGTCGGNYSGYGEAWIDWNSNSVFEASESIGTWQGAPPTTLSNFTFTVPAFALNGSTRIRVIQQEGFATLPLNPCAAFTWGGAVDFTANISGGFTPACPFVQSSSLSASNITPNSADLSWSPAASENAWDIEYSFTGFVQGAGTIASTSSTNYNLTGLVPSVSYDFYVRAVCPGVNNTSIWTGPYTFTTPCLSALAPYAQNFNSGVLPNCWSQSVISGDGWRFTGTPGYDAANNGRTAGTYAWIDFSGTDAGTVMELVPVDISSLTTPQIEFDYFCYNNINPNPTNILYIEANDIAGTWSTIDTIQTNLFNGWNPFSFSLTGYDVSGIVSLRLRAESGGASDDFYNDILIDNLFIRETPTCPSPLVSSFGVSNLTANSGNLTWLAGANETLWDVQWGISGFTIGSGNITNTTLYSGFPISGLTSTTNYDFYVRAICSAGDSSYWAGPFTFTTPCSAITPPALEDFNTGFPPSVCWNQAGDGDPSTGPSGFGTSIWNQDGFANVGFIGAVSCNLSFTGDKEWVISPQYDLSTGGPFQLEFDFGVFTAFTSNPGTLGSDDRVEVLISRDGGSSWSGLRNFNNNYVTASGGNHEIIAFPNDSGTVQFAFWASEGLIDDIENNDVMFDNFEITTMPSCPQVSTLTYNNLTSSSVDLSWLIVGSETSWNVQYGQPGFALGSGTNVVANSNTYTLANLNSANSYDVYVQAICSPSDVSLWIGPYSFTTTATCAIPTNVYASNITVNSAEILYNSVVGSTSFELEFGVSGFTLGSGNLQSVNTNPYQLGGLNSSTTYDYYLRTSCGNDYSLWAGPFSFTTSFQCPANAVCATYNSGDISSDFNYVANSEVSTCPGSVDVVIPPGYVLDSIETMYDYTAQGGAWLSEQRSRIFVPSLGLGESTSAIGSGGNTAGTESYSRMTYFSFGLNAIDTVTVELHAGRTWGGSGCNTTYNKIDDGTWLVVAYYSLPPACYSPTLIGDSNSTISSVDLYWTAGGTETAWDLEFGTSGFSQGLGTTLAITSNPYTLTGLNPSSDYDYYLRADCGTDSSIWVGPFTFSTLCATAVAPYAQNFNSSVLPNCWSQSFITGDGWRFTGTPGYAAATNGRTAGTYAWIDFSGTDLGAVMEVVSVDVSSLLSAQIKFDYFCNNTTNPNPPNTLYIEANDGTNWVVVDSVQENTIPGWNSYEFSLLGYDVNGILNIRFRAESGGSTQDFYNDILVDDLFIREAPNCPEVLFSSISADSITGTTANMSWSNSTNSTQYKVQFGNSGFSIGTGTTALSSDTTYNITGLSGSTNYDFYVMSLCGSSDSSVWTGPYTFTSGFVCPANAVCATSYSGDLPTDIDFGLNGATSNCPGELEVVIPSGYVLDSIRTMFDMTAQGGAWMSEQRHRLRVSSLQPAGPILAGLGGNIAGTESYDYTMSFPYGFNLTDTVNIQLHAGRTWGGLGCNTTYNKIDNGTWMVVGFYSLPQLCTQPYNLNVSNIGANLATASWQSYSTDSLWNVYVCPDTVLPDSSHLTVSMNNTLALTGLNPSTNYHLYVQTKCSSNDTSLLTGPFSFSTTALCPIPTNLSASNPTTNSIDLSWTGGLSQTDFDIEYGSFGFVQNTGTIVAVTSNSYSLTGLNSSSDYEYYVRSVCSNDTTLWVGPYLFSTLCDTVLAPYTQNFSSGLTPNCWSTTLVTGDGWRFTGTPGYDAANNGRTAGTYAWIDFSGTDDSAVMNIVPVDISSLTNPQIDFDFFCNNVTNPAITNTLYVEANDGTNWVLVDSIQENSVPGWNSYNFSLTGFDNNGVVSIRLRAESGGDANDFYNDILVDDLYIREAPNCFEVLSSTVNIDSISTNSAYVYWSDNASSWNIEYGTTGFVLGTGTSTIVTDTSFAISSLSAQTVYDFYIQTICGPGDSSLFTGPFSFQTLIEGPLGINCSSSNGTAGVVYTNDLENNIGWSGTFGLGATAGFWNVNSGATGSTGTGPNSSHSGNNYYYFETSGTNPATGAIVSPMIDLSSSVTDAELSFWLHAYGAEIGTLNVGVSDSVGGPFNNVFTTSGQIQAANADPYQNVGVNLANYVGQQIYLQFEYTSGTSFTGDIAIDLIEVSSCSNLCFSPTLLSSQNITNNTADLIWVAGGIESSWEIEYGLAGFPQGFGTLDTTSTNPYSLIGLSTITSYDYYVRAICSVGDTSSWSGPHTFTTLLDCPEPTNIDTISVGIFSADLTWLAGGTETSWNVEYGPSGFPQGTGFGTTQNVSSNNISLTNLLDGYSYDIYVQANCGAGDSSTWTGPYTFTTTAFCQQPTSLISDSITTSSATLSWTAGDTETEWNIEYGITGFPQGTGFGQIVPFQNNFTLSGLSDATTYDYYVQSVCGANDSSLFSGPHTFTTCQAADTFVVSSCDNYLWNGNTYDNTGNYSYSYLPIAGCDTVVDLLYLTINNSTETIDTIVTCDDYLWSETGLNYPLSGFYSETYQSIHGCDSTISLFLTINSSFNTVQTEIVCGSYLWNGVSYSTTGNYTDTLQSINGCDSIANLVLEINYSSSSSSVTLFCDSYNWNGFSYDSTGTYTDTSLNSVGCLQIDTLLLTIISSYESIDSVESCDNYLWTETGITYSSSNIYSETYQSVSGCDSVVTLDLTIKNSDSSSQSITHCDSLIWRGNTYNISGTYSDTIQNSSGCDSTLYLNLLLNPSSSNLITISSCNSYIFVSDTLTASGIYLDTSLNSFGCPQYDSLDLTITLGANSSTIIACDSANWNGTTYTTSGEKLFTNGNCVDTLDLTINLSSSYIEQQTTCDSLTWNGSTFFNSVVYNWIGQNSVGCDSVVTLDLTINNSEVNNLTVTECDSYIWNGVTYTSTQNISYSGLNSDGCDSLVNLTLNINNSTSALINETVCDSYNWNGDSLYITGLYLDSTLNSSGCLHVDSLNLVINNSSTSDTSVTACDSYFWNGLTYLSSDTISYFTSNIYGCDSIATLFLTINSSEINPLPQVTVCDSYTWNGNSYDTTGNYTYTTLTASGCDSVVNLALVVNNSTFTTSDIVDCNQYFWAANGVTYTNSGTYVETSTNIDGCLHVDSLNLVINSATFSDTTITACNSYVWNGDTLTVAGQYSDSSLTSSGCDSLSTLNLYINYDSYEVDTIVTCDSLVWIDGNTYSSDTTVNYTLSTALGCDSIMTLELTINNSSIIQDNQTSCDSVYLWNGNQLNLTGSYLDTLQSIYGCDSIVKLNLTLNSNPSSLTSQVICKGDSLKFGAMTYTFAGMYTDTLQSSIGCDSLAILDLTVTELTVSIDTSQFSLVANVTGGLAPYSYLWSNGDSISTIIPDTVGILNLIVIDASGCISDTISYNVTSTVDVISNSLDLINIYPNPSNGQFVISNSVIMRDIIITDLRGKNVYTNKNLNSNYLNIELDYLDRGMYLVNIISKNGIITKPVIIQ